MTTQLEVQNQYVADFKAFSENGAAGAPRWLRDRRARAMERFVELGFPGPRDEAWRFTDVAALVASPFAPVGNAADDDVSPADLDQYILGRVGQHRMVFVNGRYREDLSQLGDLPSVVSVGSLDRAVRTDSWKLEEHLGAHTQVSKNPFTALSTAFLADGTYLSVPDGIELEVPLLLLYLTTPGADRRVTVPRNLIVVGAGGSATVVEKYACVGDAAYWTNAVTEAVLEKNARLDTYRVQQESEQAYHTATTQSYQGPDSAFGLHTVVLGGALSRHDINAVLDGTGAECTLYGLSQLHGRQHADHHTAIEHAQPHCNSWEYFNGIYDDRSRGVFTGRIVVHPGAQRTDSKQTNNSLLLSERARSDSQPQLEIYADDVRCTHGATLGPIDDRALFYLRSRGLGAEEAKNLLTYGFGAEILGKVKLAELRERLDRLIKDRLRGRAGREVALA